MSRGTHGASAVGRSVVLLLHHHEVRGRRSRQRFTSQLNNEASAGFGLDEQAASVRACSAGLELDGQLQIVLRSDRRERRRHSQSGTRADVHLKTSHGR